MRRKVVEWTTSKEKRVAEAARGGVHRHMQELQGIQRQRQLSSTCGAYALEVVS